MSLKPELSECTNHLFLLNFIRTFLRKQTCSLKKDFYPSIHPFLPVFAGPGQGGSRLIKVVPDGICNPSSMILVHSEGRRPGLLLIRKLLWTWKSSGFTPSGSLTSFCLLVSEISLFRSPPEVCDQRWGLERRSIQASASGSASSSTQQSDTAPRFRADAAYRPVDLGLYLTFPPENHFEIPELPHLWQQLTPNQER